MRQKLLLLKGIRISINRCETSQIPRVRLLYPAGHSF